MDEVSRVTLRKRRTIFTVIMMLAALLFSVVSSSSEQTILNPVNIPTDPAVLGTYKNTELAVEVLNALPIKGRAPKTGYERSQFGDGWARIGFCDMRNIILAQQLNDVRIDADNCRVISGTLNDPYTATTIPFIRGSETSGKVQIDHVVSLSDAWQKGAQSLSYDQRIDFANDPRNLLAVDGDANQQKGSGDAATWLPENKAFRCRYIARQIAVKRVYNLWVTQAEHDAMKQILNSCEGQLLPVIQ